MYISTWFKTAKKFVGNNDWYILSAKYHLLHPDTVIYPYEQSLNTMSYRERKIWADIIFGKLQESRFDSVVILAGKKYREFLVPRLEELGIQVNIPMKGLGIGTQLKWMKEHTK